MKAGRMLSDILFPAIMDFFTVFEVNDINKKSLSMRAKSLSPRENRFLPSRLPFSGGHFYIQSWRFFHKRRILMIKSEFILVKLSSLSIDITTPK